MITKIWSEEKNSWIISTYRIDFLKRNYKVKHIPIVDASDTYYLVEYREGQYGLYKEKNDQRGKSI